MTDYLGGTFTLSRPNLLTRAKQALTKPPDPVSTTVVPHPFNVYIDPDAPVVQDGVTVRTLTPEEADRAARTVSDAQRAGVAVEAELAARQHARRQVARTAERLGL